MITAPTIPGVLACCADYCKPAVEAGRIRHWLVTIIWTFSHPTDVTERSIFLSTLNEKNVSTEIILGTEVGTDNKDNTYKNRILLGRVNLYAGGELPTTGICFDCQLL